VARQTLFTRKHIRFLHLFGARPRADDDNANGFERVIRQMTDKTGDELEKGDRVFVRKVDANDEYIHAIAKVINPASFTIEYAVHMPGGAMIDTAHPAQCLKITPMNVVDILTQVGEDDNKVRLARFTGKSVEQVIEQSALFLKTVLVSGRYL
jgi:hypothetical protein